MSANSLLVNGLVAYWKFDEGSGTNAADSSGFGIPATLVGSPGWSSSTATIGLNNPFCLNLSANTMYATTNVLSTFGSGDFSISYWVKTSASFAGVVRTIGNYNVTNPFWGTGFNASNQIYAAARDSAGNLNVATSAATYNDGNWHHVAQVKIAANVKLYIDGSLSNTGSGVTVGSPDSTQTITIGRDIATGSASNYTGLLDDMRLYKRALTAAEVSALANAKPTQSQIFAGRLYSGTFS